MTGLLLHGQEDVEEAIGAGGRQAGLQACCRNEGRVHRLHLGRRQSIQPLDQQCEQSLGDQRIGVALPAHHSLIEGTPHKHLRHTSLHLDVVGLLLGRHGRELLGQPEHVLVAAFWIGGAAQALHHPVEGITAGAGGHAGLSRFDVAR